MTPTIRLLRPSDAEAVAALFTSNDTADVVRNFHPFPLTPDTAVTVCAGLGQDAFLAAFDGGRAVGFAMLRGWDHGYEVPSFGVLVDRNAYGHGIASSLLRQALGIAALRRSPSVRLTVYDDNNRARRSYLSNDFVTEHEDEVDGRRRHVMRRVLDHIGPSVYASVAALPPAGSFIEHVSCFTRSGIRRIELGNYDPVTTMDLAAIERVDAAFLVHNYFPPPETPFVFNLASTDAGVVEASMALARDAIEWSVRLGAHFYSLHGGFVTDPIGRGPHGFLFATDPSPDASARALARFAANLVRLRDEACSRGITLLVENNVCEPHNRGTLLLQSPEEFEELFTRFDGTPGIGILLDTGHLRVSEATFGFESRRFSGRLAELVRGMHLHDNDGTADQHRPASSWALQWLECFPALAFISIEARFDSVDMLRSHAASIQSRFLTRHADHVRPH